MYFAASHSVSLVERDRFFARKRGYILPEPINSSVGAFPQKGYMVEPTVTRANDAKLLKNRHSAYHFGSVR
jgi:hypothetical protein